MAALRQWRDGLVREGRLPLGALKDSHFRLALTRGRRDERAIGSMLPAAYAHHAAEIVDVIMASDPVHPAGGAGAPGGPGEGGTWPTLPQSAVPPPGMAPPGQAPQQNPPQGQPQQQLPPQGMPPQGMPPQQGVPPQQGMPPQGGPGGQPWQPGPGGGAYPQNPYAQPYGPPPGQNPYAQPYPQNPGSATWTQFGPGPIGQPGGGPAPAGQYPPGQYPPGPQQSGPFPPGQQPPQGFGPGGFPGQAGPQGQPPNQAGPNQQPPMQNQQPHAQPGTWSVIGGGQLTPPPLQPGVGGQPGGPAQSASAFPGLQSAQPQPSAGPLGLAQPGPGAQPPSPAERRAQLAQIATQFAQLDFSEPLGEPGLVRVGTEGNAIVLTWDMPPGGDGPSVFRVIYADEFAPYAPEYAELIDITRQNTTNDEREYVHAVRWFQVWRNTGRTPAEAMRNQPTLHAQTAVVVPIQQLNLREDGGRVIGQWSVLPGVTRVLVYRIPIEQAARAGQDPTFQISTDDENLSGFVDREAVRGKRYLYRFYAEAPVSGVARLSRPIGQVVAVSAQLLPIDDLVVRGHGTNDDWQFDLSWSDPPAGRVVVYRTRNAPRSGIENEARDEAALQHGGLAIEDRLAHPMYKTGDATSGMKEVPAPEGWDRVYFTPVTVIEGKVRVGKSVSQVVIPPPEEPVIVERTDHQVLKFGWPGAAAAVAVATGPRGMDATAPQEGGNYFEISRDAYQRLGGFQFPSRLPSEGCSVHLAGMSFVNRERVVGPPVVTDYRGLLRLGYVLELRKSILQRGNQLLIRPYAERELANCPPFVLIFNAERLPLHIRDGEPLPVTPNVEEVVAAAIQFRPDRLTRQPAEVGFRTDVRGRAGFVRLFLDLPPEVLRQVALLDPAISMLAIRD